MISVVIPTLISDASQLQTTLECILKARQSPIPFELVIVETETNYLQGLADVYLWEKERTNATKSINRGLQIASGDKVVLLTNDVLVPPAWLDHLLECFELPDCGLATLGANQFNHTVEDRIEEGIWFSVAMMPKQEAYFDLKYVNSWDDSDLIMRTYLKGRRMYRNRKTVVEHRVGMTQYQKPDHEANFQKNKRYFIDKWKDFSDTPIFRVLVGGLIV